MARANRHYIPGYVWHLTHRCHQKEFLLKFARDRKRWTDWLFEARKRFNLSVLNYMVTGSKSFVEEVRRSLGVKSRGKSITGDNEQYQLRENVADFGNPRIEGFNTAASGDSDFNNTFFWEIS